jgi:hypothetical protein
MTEHIEKLISKLKLGELEDQAEAISLLTAALIEDDSDVSLLLSLMRAPQVSVCLAAIGAVEHRAEPALFQQLKDLAAHSDARVRARVAEALAPKRDSTSTSVLHTLAADPELIVRRSVLWVTAGDARFQTLHENSLEDPDFNVRMAAARALEGQNVARIVRPLARLLLREAQTYLSELCMRIIEKRLVDFPQEAPNYLPTDISQLTKLEIQVKAAGVDHFPQLTAWLKSQTSAQVDPDVLGRFGTYLTSLAAAGKLPRPHHLDDRCEALMKLLRENPSRSIALVGQAGIGKSALVNGLVYRLAEPENGAWHVLRVSPSEFLIGTKYIGEWETKLGELIEAIRKPRRVLLYIPNLADLSGVGTHSKSDTNIATALAPYLEDGSIVVLGETTPEEYERGLGRIPSLRRLFDQVLLHEPSLEKTRAILLAVRDEERSGISDQTLDQLLEVSSQFLSHLSRPGNAIALLRPVLAGEREMGRPVTFRDILESLSKSTGIPANLLDDSVPLRHAEVRQHFEARIIGQPKAVEAVVDLVTLIKAGVTDPNRPFGVFLFVGPTGVGKT